MEKLAIIGTGIAGMGCAHKLQHHYDLTIFEQNNYVGGHTNTITVNEDGTDVYMDTGFMVFNYVTYPNLCRLFEEIGAPVKKTDMSFSVQHVPSGLEYCGSGINGLFAQRKNIFSPKFIRMLMQISRFNSKSVEILDDPKYADYSLRQFMEEFGFGEEMLNKYLIPMSSAVWSTPMDLMLDFPAVTLIRFFKNHGFLGLNTQHQWYTPVNGSESYKKILIEPFRERILVNKGVSSVKTMENGVQITCSDGSVHLFDKVIFASHADQTLKMLDEPTAEQQRLLSPFNYQYNKATVHTDESVMPKTRLTWSSWNYRIEDRGGKQVPSTIYWMNSLQGVSDKKNYFVSINAIDGTIDPEKIIREIDYEHPLFDVPAMRAQAELQTLNENGPVYFCGSYFRYGFHEDAYASAVTLSEKLLADKTQHTTATSATTNKEQVQQTDNKQTNSNQMENYKKAYIAGGCFWGMEELFRTQPGIIDTEVGYIGGENDNPTYKYHPGHAEGLELTYDPAKTNFREILDYFYRIHDPSTVDRQGNDRGSSYRSAIFIQDEEERQTALEMIDLVNNSGRWPGKIVTTLEPFRKFWPAEPDHQDYLQRIPNGYTCHFERFGTFL